MSRRKKLIIANWKMNPQSFAEAKRLFNGIKKTAVRQKNIHTVVCPPFVYLMSLSKLYRGNQVSIGSQDIFYEEKGSFTGEISSSQVKDTGARYVIIGHSERRRLGETDEVVHDKIQSAREHKLIPIVCIGESERDSHGKYLNFLRQQISSACMGIKPIYMSSIVIAYEPIWAIGKRGSDAITPVKLHETTLFIRRVLSELYTKKIAIKTKILYGGSVEPDNAHDLLAEGDVQGFLVGHESLDATAFGEILKIANSY